MIGSRLDFFIPSPNLHFKKVSHFAFYIVTCSFLDNHIHIAHNVKIGENSIIAGQVGIAGSSILGNNVRIGGQAGISGHLTIGNNVEIAGGSGVIKNIPDSSKVMGYPAKNIREFLKDNK